MKSKDIKKMKDADLKKGLSDNQEKLRAARFGVIGSKSKNVKEQANLRKDIARILTRLNNNK